MKLKIIVNPISGRGKAVATAKQLEKQLSAEGIEYELLMTTHRGEAAKLCADAKQFDKVLLVSGDGTINEVIPALLHSNVPALVSPVGTGNVLAKELGLKKGAGNTVNAVKNGRVISIDVGYCSTDRYFASMLGAGIDAAIVNEFSKKRHGGITADIASYFPISIDVLTKYNFPSIRVEIDGTVITEKACFVQIANVRSYGGPFMFVRDAKPDDGLFDVFAYECKGVIPFLALFGAAFLFSAHKLSSAIIRRGKRIRLTSNEKVAFQLDGDPAGFLPVDVEIIPSSLKVVTLN